MTTLRFQNGADAYDIHIGKGLLSQAGELFNLKRKVLVVTDEGVPSAYPQAVLDCCQDGCSVVLAPGERHKNLSSVERILQELADHGFSRGDAIVAVGGGVVGDTAGFAAACYMRGIEWYNVPTTLLSQVDASVGGKTGVNFGGLKNMVGAFHQPSGVIADTHVLKSLSPRLFAEGLAETVKMAATLDAQMFARLERVRDVRNLQNSASETLERLVSDALRLKIDIVSRDPGEKGLRAVLNFGHTIGHAIEAASSGPIYHGEAVAIGMMYFSTGEARERIGAILRRFGLPTSDSFSAQTLLAFAKHDKKKTATGYKVVFVDEIGSYRFDTLSSTGLMGVIKQAKQ